MQRIIRRPATIVAILLLGGGDCVSAEPGMNADFHVAPGGSDTNPGTREKPFATLSRARDAVRTLDKKRPISVLVGGGTYRLERPLEFGPEDSGTETCSITYVATAGEKPILSGGRRLTGWRRGEGDVWTVQVPGVAEGAFTFHQLWVDGRRAVRARTPNADAPAPCGQLASAALDAATKTHTYFFAPGQLASWGNLGDVEAVVFGNWEITRKRFDTVQPATGTARMLGPHARPHEAIAAGPGRYFYLENAREFLDQPGEWYLDRKTGMLHYWPRRGEDLATAEVVAPVLSRLLTVEGTPAAPVRNLHFQGLELAHADWTYPAGGYLGVQACHFTTGTDWDKAASARIDAAVRWDHAEDSSFEDGAIAHVGGCGIELNTRCVGCTVAGNHIHDVSGNGIILGGPRVEADVPGDCRIANNRVHACGVDYAGAVGIWVGFARRAVIAHNEVFDLPYTGISLGWQWDPEPTPARENTVEGNHVHHVMNRLGDGGCIYTLGFQPGTRIVGNHLHDVNRSALCQAAPNNGMFIDEGSKGFHFERNVVYATSGEPVRFNQCQENWHTWKDNAFGVVGSRGPGVVGRGLSCTGGSLDVPHSAELDPERFTVGCWIRFEELPAGEDDRRWIVNKNGNEWTEGHWALVVSGKDAGAYLNVGGGRENCFAAFSRTAPLETGRWQHLAASYDGATLRVYVDGTAVATQPVNRRRTPGGGALAIGRRQDGFATSAFSGAIDEIRLYDRALDSSGMEVLARRPTAGDPPAAGLIRSWAFDEAAADGTATIIEQAGLEPRYRNMLEPERIGTPSR